MSKLIKEQLQGMSDFDLDFALKRTIYVSSKIDEQKRQIISCCENLINEVSFLMSIAFDHIARIEKIGERWFVESLPFEKIYCYRCDDTNPLRAIACCLILVLQDGS